MSNFSISVAELVLYAMPAHKASWSLTHNPHKSYYDLVEEHTKYYDLDWVSEEQKSKAIAADEMWVMRWYPNTPIGFEEFAAYDLYVLQRI